MQTEKENKMPNLYMLVGEPGCGKSYWTERNAAKLDAVVISSDIILYEHMERDNISYQEAFEEYMGDSMKEMKIRAREAINQGKNIIWDQTNTTVKSRSRKLKQFDGYHKTAVFFNIDPYVVDERLALREAETGKHIPDFVMKNFRKIFVSPSKEEGFDKIMVIR